MKIFVAGHRGMVGSAIVRKLQGRGDPLILKTRAELDLTSQSQVRSFMNEERPDAVILAAAKVGGILANSTYPAEFIYENITIQSNIINFSFEAGVRRLLFLGSSCIYPRESHYPMPEEALLEGPLEPTNEPYAIAKIAGIKMCESFNRQYNTDYRSIMPTNLYGPGDNFHYDNSHVLPALIRRFHEAKIDGTKQVSIWGSGVPRREFLHVDDMASAALFLFDMDRDRYESNTSKMLSHVNIGVGEDISIYDLACIISDVVGYNGEIVFDKTKPDGVPRKLLDVSKINKLGWRPSIKLEDGIRETYQWFVQNQDRFRNY